MKNYILSLFIFLIFLIINFSLVYAVYTDTITIDAGDLYIETENEKNFEFNEESKSFSVQDDIEFSIEKDSLTIKNSNPVEVEFKSTLEIDPVSKESVDYQSVKLTTEDAEFTVSSPKKLNVDMSYVGNGLNIFVGEEDQPILFTNLPSSSFFEIGEKGKIKSVEIKEVEEEVEFGLAELIVEEDSKIKTENIEITFNNEGEVKIEDTKLENEKVTFTGEANIGLLNVDAGENKVTVSVPEVAEGKQEKIHITSEVVEDTGEKHYESFSIADNQLQGEFNIGENDLEILNPDGVFISGEGIFVQGAGNVDFLGEENNKDKYVSIGDGKIVVKGNQEVRILPDNELIESDDYLVLKPNGGTIKLEEEQVLTIEVEGKGTIVNGDSTIISDGKNVFVRLDENEFRDSTPADIKFKDENGNPILVNKNGEPAELYNIDNDQGSLVLADNSKFNSDGTITCPQELGVTAGVIGKAIALITGKATFSDIFKSVSKVEKVHRDCVIHEINLGSKGFSYLSTAGLDTKFGEYVEQNIEIIYNKVREEEIKKLITQGLTQEEAIAQIDKDDILSKTLSLVDCSEIPESDCNGHITQFSNGGELNEILSFINTNGRLPGSSSTEKKFTTKKIGFEEEITIFENTGILPTAKKTNVEVSEFKTEKIKEPERTEADTSGTFKMTVNTKMYPMKFIFLEEDGSPEEKELISLIKQAQEKGSIEIYEDEFSILKKIAEKVGWSVGDSTKHTIQIEKL